MCNKPDPLDLILKWVTVGLGAVLLVWGIIQVYG